MLKSLKSRVFYGWFMVGAGFGIQLLTGGLMNQAYGAYVVLLQQDFGWSKTMLSAGFSMARFESGLLGPVEGWLIDRFGPRAVMRVGLVIFALGFMALSQINSLLTFYRAFFTMALGSSLGGFLPLTVTIVNWFRRRRATALATMQTGFAVGGLCVPLVVLSLETIGWRNTAFLSGCLVLAIALPLSQLIRHRPEDIGEVMDGNAYVPPRNLSAEADEDVIDFQPSVSSEMTTSGTQSPPTAKPVCMTARAVARRRRNQLTTVTVSGRKPPRLEPSAIVKKAR